MDAQEPDEGARSAEEPKGPVRVPASPERQDVLGQLESLLAKEGVGDLGPDATAEPLAGADARVARERAVLPPQRPAPPGSRQAREQRRRRDQRELQALDGLMVAGPVEVVVAADRLSAEVTRVDPSMRVEDLRQLLARHGVVHGVDEAALVDAVARAGRGQAVRSVVVARGTPVTVVQEAGVRYMPGFLNMAEEFARLSALLQDAPTADVFHSWRGPVCAVGPGDVLAELVSAVVQPGCDVLGQPIAPPAAASATLWGGDNTSWSPDGTCCLATIHGYAGLLDEEPAVIPPVWVSPDHMEARFVYLRSARRPSRPPDADDVRRLLQLRWVEHGVQSEQLERLCRRLAAGQSVPPTSVVARGKPAVPGHDAEVRLAWDTQGQLDWAQLTYMLSPRSVESLRAVLQEAVRMSHGQPLCRAVRPGDVLAEKIPVTEGVPGWDVEGDELLPAPGEDRALLAGENTALSEDGLRCSATGHGYAVLYLEQVHVVSPVWVAPDRMAAYYVNLPTSGGPGYPTLEDLYPLLDRAGVRHGFSGDEWSLLRDQLEAGRTTDLLVRLAAGTPAQPGQDTVFDWAIDTETHRAGRVLEDGSIDFRERHLATVVGQGTLIGVLCPSSEGAPGRDVLGNELLPPRAQGLEVMTDARIRAQEEEGGRTAFYAESGGAVVRQSEARRGKQRVRNRVRIGISPTTSIDGDVDYSTGNIDFHGDVVIQGSVQSLFSVKATGDVSIGGTVEAGAFVATGRDILVKGGVVGAGTQLVAGGSVVAKFIQEASIRAARDVQAGAYLFNASVRAGGKVTVLGKGEGKQRALVGGLVWAAEGIEATSVGSPYSSSTRLVAGVDPDRVVRIDQLSSNLAACEERRRSMLERIGLESLDLELVRRRLKRAVTMDQKKAVATVLRRLARIAELADSMRRELDELARAQRELARRAAIIVRHRLHAGVEVRLGDVTLAVRDDCDHVRLRLVEDDSGQERIEVGPTRS